MKTHYIREKAWDGILLNILNNSHTLHDQTFYVVYVKNKLSQEPLYIHTQVTCYRLTK